MAISLWQPWAQFMAEGVKTIETRSWPTKYRGPLAIHAAKRNLDQTGLELVRRFNIPIGLLEFGAVIAVCDLFGCHATDSVRELMIERDGHGNVAACSNEYDLGDYSTGRFAWITRNVRKLETPIPMRGRQGFWRVEI